MAKQEVSVQFNDKYIASISGLTWDDTEKKWYGTAKAIQTFEKNKIRFQEITQSVKTEPENPEEPLQSGLSEEEWENLLENHTSTLELVEAIHSFGMPENQEQRIRILNFFNKKAASDYPVYYNDISRYCKQFKARYPRDKINDLIVTNGITGKDLERELQNAYLNDEEFALLRFVFS